MDVYKIFDVSELFDVILIFFRCFFSVFSLSMFCLFCVFAFLCFVVLCFVIDPLQIPVFAVRLRDPIEHSSIKPQSQMVDNIVFP